MKIYVKSKDAPTIRINLPTGLLLNRFTAKAGLKCLEKYCSREGWYAENSITEAQAYMLFSEIQRFKKKYPDWYLVDVETADGEIIKIKP